MCIKTEKDPSSGKQQSSDFDGLSLIHVYKFITFLLRTDNNIHSDQNTTIRVQRGKPLDSFFEYNGVL